MEDHIKKIFNALSIFESMNPRNIPVHHVQAFLFIASNHSVTFKDIEKEFSVTNASANRIVHSLASNPKHRETSLGIVEIYIDPQEGRRYRIRTNAAGKALKKSLDVLK